MGIGGPAQREEEQPDEADGLTAMDEEAIRALRYRLLSVGDPSDRATTTTSSKGRRWKTACDGCNGGKRWVPASERRSLVGQQNESE